MVYPEFGKKPTGTAVRRAAWGAVVVGGILLAYSLSQPSNRDLPDWQPVNASLKAALSTEAPVEPSPAVHPSDSIPTSPALSSGSPESTPAGSPSGVSATVDLNSATAADLDGLPGIGPAKAKTIMAYRQAHHGFGSVDELLQVKGIGPKLLDKIRPHVSVTRSGHGP